MNTIIYTLLYTHYYIHYYSNFDGLIYRQKQIPYISGNFRGSYILQKVFRSLIFIDHQVEYIVPLSHCFFLRIKILHSASSEISEIYVPQKLLHIW